MNDIVEELQSQIKSHQAAADLGEPVGDFDETMQRALKEITQCRTALLNLSNAIDDMKNDAYTGAHAELSIQHQNAKAVLACEDAVLIHERD